MTTSMGLDIINSGLAIAVIIRLILTADTMTKATRHCFRVSLVVMSLVMLGVALWPIYGEWPKWMDVALTGAIALYVYSDRRARSRYDDQSKTGDSNVGTTR